MYRQRTVPISFDQDFPYLGALEHDTGPHVLSKSLLCKQSSCLQHPLHGAQLNDYSSATNTALISLRCCGISHPVLQGPLTRSNCQLGGQAHFVGYSSQALAAAGVGLLTAASMHVLSYTFVEQSVQFAVDLRAML